jgi:hypothetical protein
MFLSRSTCSSEVKDTGIGRCSDGGRLAQLPTFPKRFARRTRPSKPAVSLFIVSALVGDPNDRNRMPILRMHSLTVSHNCA